MKLQCLLVDDEPPALEVLESYIEMVPGLEIVNRCQNAIEAFQVLQEKKVDLMFLDIKMPKINGADFLKSLRNSPKVIFTSAYREYALEGFELDVVDYLLKPISFERFLKAISKVLNPSHEKISHEAEKLQPNKEAFLYFRTNRKMVKVLTANILFIESLKDYIKIISIDERPIIVKQTIGSMEEMLPDSNFIRIHRSYIAAIDKIKAFTHSHLEIFDRELPIGRLYQKEVERILK